MEKEPLPLGDWNRALSALDRDQPAEDEVEESWDWDPEATAPEADSSAPAPPVVRSAAAIWAWVPEKAPAPEDLPQRGADLPPDLEPVDLPPDVELVDLPPDVELVETPVPRGRRNRKRKKAPARADVPQDGADLPPDVEPVDLPPDVELAETPEPRSRRNRKRKKAPQATPEVAVAPTTTPVPVKSKAKRKTKSKPLPKPDRAPRPDPAPEVVGKRRRGRKNVVVPDWDVLDGEEPADDVPPPSRRRKVVKVVLVAALIAACATLPWVAPQVPDLFAKVVPESTSTPAPSDPPVDPLTSPPPTTVTPDPTLVGTRLKSAGKPLELWVPRLHVRSEVIPISGQSGELLPPDDPQVLGWWQEGRYAGAGRGSVVITGHTVNGGGGAFDHLGELVPGDKIRVRTEAGSIRYVVQESRDVSVAKLARTAEEIFNQQGDGRLVLITCSDFNGEVYLSNAIVYATPVKDEPVVDEPETDGSPTATPFERY